MVTLVSDKINEIQIACKEMHVASLYLFGSGARTNDFNTDSDLDFLYSFQTDEGGYLLPPFYDYFDLLWKLETITGKKVDLVAEKVIKNKYFLEEVQKDRVKIYERHP